MLIVLRCIDGRHILCSFVQFLDFLKFLYSGDCLQICWSLLLPQCNGVLVSRHFANKYWVCLLFSQYPSKLMECPFLAQDIVLSYTSIWRLSTCLLGHMIIFIPVAAISYVALSSVILYPPKRSGAQNTSSKQKCVNMMFGVWSGNHWYSGRPLGFYQILTTKKKTEYRPNIDHTAFYRPKYRPTKFL